MNKEWLTLKMNGLERYEFMKQRHYKRLMATYLYLRYVSPKQIEPKMRQNGFVWVPFQFPTLLFWILSMDENGAQNSFKIMQFDYLWKHSDDSMIIMRCWITNECDYNANKLKMIKSNQTNTTKNNAKAQGSASMATQAIVRDIYQPCYQSLVHLLTDRPELLLGKWMNWKHWTWDA